MQGQAYQEVFCRLGYNPSAKRKEFLALTVHVKKPYNVVFCFVLTDRVESIAFVIRIQTSDCFITIVSLLLKSLERMNDTRQTCSLGGSIGHTECQCWKGP